MKHFALIITILVTPYMTLAFGDYFKFNSDVFKCPNGYKSIFGVEMDYGVYNANPIRLNSTKKSFEEEFELLVNQLKIISPSRAYLLKDIFDSKNTKVTYKKNIRFIRSSPASNIVNPEGCSVEPITHFEMNEEGFRIIFNQDIFDALTIEDKIYTAFNLSLDIEQVLFSNYLNYGEINKINLDQIHAKQFLACWYDPKCHPNNNNEMNKIVINRAFKFYFLEQDGIVMPLYSAFPNEFKFHSKTGYIDSAKYAFSAYEKKYLGDYFNSFFIFRGKKYPFSVTNGVRDISFSEYGKVHCVPKIPEPISITAINDGALLNWNRICFNEQDNIEKIEFPDINLRTDLVFIRINDKKMYIPNSSEFRFYKNEKLNWISNIKDSIVFNKQHMSQNGMLKLFPSGKIQCLQLDENYNFKAPNGQMISMTVDPNSEKTDLFCFKEDGNIDRSYKLPYFEAYKKIP